jgi:HD-GYP domain-containing protein (c-di-GMP phosphodiesterase class II)
MKRKLFVPIVITLITILVVGVFFWGLQMYVADRNFHTTDHALESVIDLQASAVYNGYFAWTTLYDTVVQGDLSEANELVQDGKENFPLIESLEFEQGIPPEGKFAVTLDGELLRIEYPIRDDGETRTAPNVVAVAVIQAQRLLEIVSPHEFRVDIVHGRRTSYGIPVSTRFPLFNPWNISFMALLTGLIVWLILQHYFRRSDFFLDTRGLESIIYLFEQTEKFSASHSRNVAIFALFIGKKLGFRGRRLRNLYIAALLHDIGKIGVPTSIITKTGKLDAKEFAQMKQHPVISARILRGFKGFEHLSTIVLHHHEREDGSGYPDGLKGKAIPLESKIIAVVDVFEALVGERPYRNPIHPSSAFEKLKQMPLDQQIVSILVGHYGELRAFKPPRWVLSYSPWIQ